MADFSVTQTIVIAAVPSIVTLLGVAYTQWRADRRETKVRADQKTADEAKRGRELRDRWFEDRKVAYMEVLEIGRACLRDAALFVAMGPIGRLSDEAVLDQGINQKRLQEKLGVLELFGSQEAVDLVAKLSIELAQLYNAPEAEFIDRNAEIRGLFPQIRIAVREHLDVDGIEMNV